jgi:hypothetical protein
MSLISGSCSLIFIASSSLRATTSISPYDSVDERSVDIKHRKTHETHHVSDLGFVFVDIHRVFVSVADEAHLLNLLVFS